MENNLEFSSKEDKNNLEFSIKEEKYNGWLISNNLVKRSLAVVGHYFLWYIIILIPAILIWAIIVFISKFYDR